MLNSSHLLHGLYIFPPIACHLLRVTSAGSIFLSPSFLPKTREKSHFVKLSSTLLLSWIYLSLYSLWSGIPSQPGCG